MVQFRSYAASEAAAFHRVRDRFGAFSNMAAGYPVRFGGVEAPSSEALYQALRFPDLPGFQGEILSATSPILAKRHAYTRIRESRSDWEAVKVNVMRFVLRAKFGAHQSRLLPVLAETGERPIVEISHRDDFWGARPEGGRLHGRNVLGRLLMELRLELAAHPIGAPLLVAPRFARASLLGSELGPERVGDIAAEPDTGPFLL
ncbi:type I restriction enzyme S subunit/hypothetical protein [Gemmobacter caeni]|uniref:NADAR domain-containing protein n=1 Tax=Gemmobacter caeni TaxID=589035 RepID=A0A2T6B996_9RHOB|nr:NADAR family protein [Gemmobacter caeni]PTX52650.1 hypothetical protein C8N34_102468 [Gemmobacter caeni]TWI94895.1 type I restriction enzyme S subunit/hypothetical protein [Gemmobacter caeni]